MGPLNLTEFGGRVDIRKSHNHVHTYFRLYISEIVIEAARPALLEA